MCNYTFKESSNCPLLVKANERKSTLLVVHELKIHPEHFKNVVSGDKKHEIRDNEDRNFNVGDTLLLREWEPSLKVYTGLAFDVKITYISRVTMGIPDNISIMSVEPTNAKRIYQHDFKI